MGPINFVDWTNRWIGSDAPGVSWADVTSGVGVGGTSALLTARGDSIFGGRTPIATIGESGIIERFNMREHLTDMAKVAGRAAVVLDLAGTVAETSRELIEGNVPGAIREGTTGLAAVGGAYVTGAAVGSLALGGATVIGATAIGTTAGVVVAVGISATSDYFSDGIEGGIQSLIDAGHAVVTAENEVLMTSEAFAALAGFENALGADFLNEFNSSASDVVASGGRNLRNLLDNVTSSDFRARDYQAIDSDSCFAAGTPIDMWPLDPEFASDPTNPHKQYDQAAVRAKVWTKPIEQIEVGDIVVSFDENNNLVPGPVTRTFQNDAKILLDFHGTRVTPGHVYFRPDNEKSYKFETLIDVLRDDGVIKHQDGTLIRAATNAPVGSAHDNFVKAVTGTRNADGTLDPKDAGRIRLGTRVLIGTGKTRKSWAVADLIEAACGVVGDDELIRAGDGPPMPFHWEFGDTLPKPEDFVLACSGTTLEDIYKAAEWESQGPRLPAPMVMDRGPVQPLQGAALSVMPRNELLEVVHAPIVPAKPERALNRK